MSDATVGHLLTGLHTIGRGPAGATPLEADEFEGLIPTFVATRADLDQVEFENIVRSLPWARLQARTLSPVGILDHVFLFSLHRRMFGDVWRWAGTQRRRDTTIGVPVHQIPEQIKQALDDARFWDEHDVFPVDERAARIHHRLVRVHPFPNGNGRCTRLIADLYLLAGGTTPFSWGSARADQPNEIRETYLAAIRRADSDDCAPLVAFARS